MRVGMQRKYVICPAVLMGAVANIVMNDSNVSGSSAHSSSGTSNGSSDERYVVTSATAHRWTIHSMHNVAILVEAQRSCSW